MQSYSFIVFAFITIGLLFLLKQKIKDNQSKINRIYEKIETMDLKINKILNSINNKPTLKGVREIGFIGEKIIKAVEEKKKNEEII